MKKKKILTYNPLLKDLAKELRNKSTLSEVLLWQHLKGRQLLGYDFDRQKPIDNFIVDFFSYELMLAIEIDGATHNYKISRDIERQKKIERLGVRFLRFADEEVKQNIEGVLVVIKKWINENRRILPTPPPLPRGDLPTPAPLQGGELEGRFNDDNHR